MGGVGENYVNPYIQKAVNQFNWTVVIFEQYQINTNSNTKKFERREQTIISPGININADNFSTITMFIYLESVTNYIRNNNLQPSGIINIGIAYIDCLTGENGIMAINNSSANDLSIPMDEILKLLIIKNPNELVIYLNDIENCDDEFITGLHLFNYNYRIDRSGIPENFFKHRFQVALLDNVYIKHRGIMDIIQQLNIDGPENHYSRIALCLLVDFITNHDKTIIQKLEMPDIIINSDKYLMLANNCLINNTIRQNINHNNNSTNQNKNNNYKRISLLELLDNTKTPMGKALLRQRLSIPITISEILETRYSQIDELYNIYMNYLIPKNTGASIDKYGSELYQIRNKLSNIKNIENYMRKIITFKLQPFEISTYIESLNNCIELLKYSAKIFENSTHIKKLLPDIKYIDEFITIRDTFQNELILDNLGYNMWSGIQANPFKKKISSNLDNLQEEIENDKNFLNMLLTRLSYLIDKNYNPEKDKALIHVSENASKGIHIHTTTNRKEILEKYFISEKLSIKIGNYIITHKDIKFEKMKEAKWEIIIPQLMISNGTLKLQN